jgi:hypothetical protein
VIGAGVVPTLRLVVVGAAAAAALLPMNPAAVERWYSTGVYLRLQRALTPVSNLLPVAWLDFAAAAAAVWVCWVWWRALRPNAGRRLPRVGHGALTTAVGAAAVYLLFIGLWGLNYRRVPIADRLAMRAEAPSTERVVELGRSAVSRLNSLHEEAHRTGWRVSPWRNVALREAFVDVQQQLGIAPAAVPGRLKATVFGTFFRWTAVDGMINPFGLEVVANPDLLPFEEPFVAAHEWSHLAGYADESEANFIGWLTAVRADVGSQYSGWLYLYWQIAGELPGKERQLLARELREGPRSDVAAIVARLQRSDVPALRRATWMVYDSYLKANRVEEGVRSYGAVVTLILRARFDDGWRPVLARP